MKFEKEKIDWKTISNFILGDHNNKSTKKFYKNLDFAYIF